jgi:hypothetical protein
MFSLPICKETDTYVPLIGKQLSDLQKKFEYVTHIKVDEYSMVSQLLLAKVDGRLKQAKARPDVVIGGLSCL